MTVAVAITATVHLKRHFADEDEWKSKKKETQKRRAGNPGNAWKEMLKNPKIIIRAFEKLGLLCQLTVSKTKSWWKHKDVNQEYAFFWKPFCFKLATASNFCEANNSSMNIKTFKVIQPICIPLGTRLQKCCLQKLNLQPLLVKQINTKFASTKNDLSDKRPKWSVTFSTAALFVIWSSVREKRLKW